MFRQGVKLAFGAFLLAILGCSSSQKTTKTADSATTGAVAVLSTLPVEQAKADTVFRDTVFILSHASEPFQPSLGLFQTLTPEQKAEELYATGVSREYGFAPTLHYDLRKPLYVMIHHTSQNSLAQTIRTFQLEHTKVSSHYVIGRDGQVVQMLNDYMRSWHAGAGKWGPITDMNSVSIGIELDNNGREPFPEPQINALLILLDTLKTKYRIPQANFIGHSDYAPSRKDDPSSFFPWQTLAERGFGMWYNDSYLQAPPATFNVVDALRIIGYDTTNLRAAIRAFKKKFIRTDTSPELTPYDVMVIYDLYSKY